MTLGTWGGAAVCVRARVDFRHALTCVATLIAIGSASAAEPALFQAVVRTSTSVRIDGQVTRREWFPATTMPPLHDAVNWAQVNVGARVLLQHDGSNLVVGFVIPRPVDWGRPKVVLTPENRALGRKRMTDLQGGEDRVRLTLRLPSGQSLVVEGNAGSVCTSEPAEAAGAITYRSSIHGDRWEGECRIGATCLDNAREFDFDFANVQETPDHQEQTLSFGDRLMTVRLDDAPVQVVTPTVGAGPPERLAVLHTGSPTRAASVTFRWSRVNLRPEADAARLDLARLLSQLTNASDRVDTVSLAPRGRREFALPFPDEEGSYAMRYVLEAEGHPLANGLWLKSVPGPWNLQLTPYFLKYHKVRCDLRSTRSPAPDEELRAVFTLRDAASKVLDRADCSLNGTEGHAFLDLAALREGQPALVKVTVFAGNKPVGSVEQKLVRPKHPDWWGHRLGLETEVPRPFEPLRVSMDRERVDLWQRTYDFGGTAFPQQISARGTALVSAPIRFVAKAGGRTLNWPAGSWQTQEVSPRAVRFVYRATNDLAHLTARVLVEFDGMIRYDLQLRPAKECASLDGLILEVPLRKDFARYYAYGYVYTDLEKARGHDNDDVGPALFPKTGISIGALDRYFALHPDGSMPFCAGFYLGSYDRGIQFFAENDRNWNNRDEEKVIQLERRAEDVVLKVHFIDQPTALTNPLDLTFGLIATPLRDNRWEREHLRSWVGLQIDPPAHESFNRRYYALARGYSYKWGSLYARMEGLFGAPRTYSASQLDDFLWLRGATREHGLSFLYFSGWGIAPNVPGSEAFTREMFAEPVRDVGYGTYRFNLNSPYTDYYLAGVAYMVTNAGARGVHLDSSYIWFDILANELDGYGFVKNGRRHGSWPIFATREFAKRLYTMLNDGHLTTDRCVINGGYSYPMYAYSGFVSTKAAYEDYYHLKVIRDIRLDSFLLRSADLLNGVHGNLGWGNWNKLPIMENEFLTVCLLHGVWVNATGELMYKRDLNELDPYRRDATPQGPLMKLFREFNAAEAEFHPYYLDDKLADTGSAALYCTAYVRRGAKALVILGNVGDRDAEGAVKFDWNKLGLDDRRATIRDGLLPDAILRRDAEGRVRVLIKAQLYRVLICELEAGAREVRQLPQP
ncbi:MAG: hypothetical protein JOZ63_04405 [Planctomycetaceae bacterium]|nr:hypothetical protein [Planctomycetaceae bacterium]